MDKEWVRRHLPEQPPKGLISWARKHYGETELGGEFVIFTSRRIAGQKEWAAECTCTACQEDFITQKEPGERAIRMICGEDGSYYTAEPWEDVEPNEIVRAGDEFYCPLCGSKVELIHSSALRGGRKKQLMVLSVENIGRYTAVLYWLVWRTVDEDGLSAYGATPEEAYVLAETGGLTRYSHVYRLGSFFGSNRSYLPEWKQMSDNRDVIDKAYPDWRSINTRKAVANIYPVVPDLEGTTGEKTALEEYIKADGYRIVEYLKWWRRRKNIENLCRQGQAKLVAEIVSKAWRFSCSVDLEAAKYIDTGKRKPHEMLRMTKEEFRYLRKRKFVWTIEAATVWKRYRSYGGRLGLMEFLPLAEEFRAGGMNAALDLMRLYGDADLDKIARYLRKGGLHMHEAGILLDTRNNQKKLYGRELTGEELWPKHLHEVHDRVNRMLLEQKSKAEAEKLRKGFDGVLAAYGHLQWTDGELEVLLPRNNRELVYEGDVLRHCVGGYGNAHISGSSVIFFIRHHRRPERPYYTLAIDMTGRPKEKQLHGYGNERHGDRKQYSHSIPRKVRSFCDRWENEVLLAWYAEAQKQNKEKSA